MMSFKRICAYFFLFANIVWTPQSNAQEITVSSILAEPSSNFAFSPITGFNGVVGLPGTWGAIHALLSDPAVNSVGQVAAAGAMKRISNGVQSIVGVYRFDINGQIELLFENGDSFNCNGNQIDGFLPAPDFTSSPIEFGTDIDINDSGSVAFRVVDASNNGYVLVADSPNSIQCAAGTGTLVSNKLGGVLSGAITDIRSKNVVINNNRTVAFVGKFDRVEPTIFSPRKTTIFTVYDLGTGYNGAVVYAGEVDDGDPQLPYSFFDFSDTDWGTQGTLDINDNDEVVFTARTILTSDCCGIFWGPEFTTDSNGDLDGYTQQYLYEGDTARFSLNGQEVTDVLYEPGNAASNSSGRISFTASDAPGNFQSNYLFSMDKNDINGSGEITPRLVAQFNQAGVNAQFSSINDVGDVLFLAGEGASNSANIGLFLLESSAPIGGLPVKLIGGNDDVKGRPIFGLNNISAASFNNGQDIAVDTPIGLMRALPVECKIDLGDYFYQGNPNDFNSSEPQEARRPVWADLRSAYSTALPSNTIAGVGCTTTTYTTLMKYAGVNEVLNPTVSDEFNTVPTDPGSVNQFLKVFQSSGFNATNDLTDQPTETAINVGNALLYEQCLSNQEANCSSRFNYNIDIVRQDFTDPSIDKVAYVKGKLCHSTNPQPVIIKTKSISQPTDPERHHFVIARGVVTLPNGNETFLIHDPQNAGSTLLSNVRYDDEIRNAITIDNLGENVGPKVSRLVVTVIGEVNVLLSDPSGRRVGVDSGGGVLKEIPESVYFRSALSSPLSMDSLPLSSTIELKDSSEILNGTFSIEVTGVPGNPFQISVVKTNTDGRVNLRETYRGVVLQRKEDSIVAFATQTFNYDSSEIFEGSVVAGISNIDVAQGGNGDFEFRGVIELAGGSDGLSLPSENFSIDFPGSLLKETVPGTSFSATPSGFEFTSSTGKIRRVSIIGNNEFEIVLSEIDSDIIDLSSEFPIRISIGNDLFVGTISRVPESNAGEDLTVSIYWHDPGLGLKIKRRFA